MHRSSHCRRMWRNPFGEHFHIFHVEMLLGSTMKNFERKTWFNGQFVGEKRIFNQRRQFILKMRKHMSNWSTSFSLFCPIRNVGSAIYVKNEAWCGAMHSFFFFFVWYEWNGRFQRNNIQVSTSGRAGLLLFQSHRIRIEYDAFNTFAHSLDTVRIQLRSAIDFYFGLCWILWTDCELRRAFSLRYLQ